MPQSCSLQLTLHVQVYTGGIENSVNVWDLRKGEIAMTLPGHDDTITGLSVSPDGNLLLSNSMVRMHACTAPCRGRVSLQRFRANFKGVPVTRS